MKGTAPHLVAAEHLVDRSAEIIAEFIELSNDRSDAFGIEIRSMSSGELDRFSAAAKSGDIESLQELLHRGESHALDVAELSLGWVQITA